MPDLTSFESRLADLLKVEASAGIRPLDSHAVARSVIENGGRRGSMTGVARRSWLLPIAAALALAALAGWSLILPGQQARPIPDPISPPAVLDVVWPGFRLLSNAEAGISIQVPIGWGRDVGHPDGFTRALAAGTGNAGLTVLAPRDNANFPNGMDLESTVVAALGDPGWAAWEPYTRTDVAHGSHRAVRLDSRARADGDYVGGHVLYIVERPGDRPVLVSLMWDSVTDLGYVEEAILRSFNVDGAGPAVLPANVAGSSSFVTMTDAGCSAAGPQFTPSEETAGLSVANHAGHVADLNLLRVGSSYELLEDDVQAAAEAITAGRDPTWENAASTTWIGDVYLPPRSDGRLMATIPPGTYAVMCFPVGEHDESLGVHLTLPFDVVTP
jgi:hypothetical protein